jgi:hypothetical protein
MNTFEPERHIKPVIDQAIAGVRLKAS